MAGAKAQGDGTFPEKDGAPTALGVWQTHRDEIRKQILQTLSEVFDNELEGLEYLLADLTRYVETTKQIAKHAARRSDE